jgi:hypothetical protein
MFSVQIIKIVSQCDEKLAAKHIMSVVDKRDSALSSMLHFRASIICKEFGLASVDLSKSKIYN